MFDTSHRADRHFRNLQDRRSATPLECRRTQNLRATDDGEENLLLKMLKWTQLVVAVTAAVLSGLIWPGVMVVIPVAIGVFYVISAAGAFRDWKPAMWSAFLLSLGVLGLSTTAIFANNFGVFRIESEMGDPPMVVVSSTGDHRKIDSIPEGTLVEMRRDYASVVARQRVIAALMLLVAVGSWAVVFMHGFAWQWLVSSIRSLS